MSKRTKFSLASAIDAIDEKKILLVFSIKNKLEVPSLWSHFYPRSEMKWEWNDDGDSRVADLWHLREKISSSGKAVYAKWYQGRATLISKDIFPSLLRVLNPFERLNDEEFYQWNLNSEAQEMLRRLEDNSPLSTKALKELTGLKGKDFEPNYHFALNQIWRRLLIVGCGEVDDGAFPSLAMGATKILFEEEWVAAQSLTGPQACLNIESAIGRSSPFFKYAERLRFKR